MQAMFTAFLAILVIAVGANVALNDPEIVDKVTDAVNMELNDGVSDSSVRLD